MTSIIKYGSAYVMWIVDLALALWLMYISRTVFLGIFALFYKPGAWIYSRRVDVADKFFLILLGLGWLIFMIAVEAYFRAGAANDDLPRRFARVTGPVLLVIFCVDLILFWLQGVGAREWLRWFFLAAELGIGMALFMSANPRSKPKPT